MKRPMPGPPAYGHYPNYYPHEHPDDALGLCPGCDIDDQAERAAPPKRLTGIGCAAEYWSAMHEHADAVGRSWFYEDPATVNAERIKATRAGDRARTWHRFATRPHALEES